MGGGEGGGGLKAYFGRALHFSVQGVAEQAVLVCMFDWRVKVSTQRCITLW